MRGVWRLRVAFERARDAWRVGRAEAAVSRFPRHIRKRAHGLPWPLIVSLTSHPARFAMLANTLRSLLDQDMAADRTVLWIAHADMAALPPAIPALRAHGLEIVATDDVGPFTKIIPALDATPHAGIVTADDDIHYPPSWLAALVAGAKRHPGAIVCHRAHRPVRCGDGLAPYAAWEYDLAPEVDIARGVFATGVGGVLYPPGSLPDEAIRREAFLALSPQADDLWLFWMARIAGTPVVKIAGHFPLVFWRGSQAVGLYLVNGHGLGHDRQIAAMGAAYGFAPVLEQL